jgi:hypothetical protein
MDPSVTPQEPPKKQTWGEWAGSFIPSFASKPEPTTPAPTTPVGGRKSKRSKTYRKEKRPAKRRRNGRRSIRS